MIDFAKLFQDNYQFYLDSINYKVITIGPVTTKVELKHKDTLSFSIENDNALKMTIKRKICFNPNIVYELSVEYGAILCFNDSFKNMDEISSINWEKEFKETPACIGLLQGLLSRISLQIAQITSSYGQNPLITPPNL